MGASAKVLWPSSTTGHERSWGEGAGPAGKPLERTRDVGLGRTEPGWGALIENIGLALGRVLGRGKCGAETGQRKAGGERGDVGSCGPQEERPSARMARRLVLGDQGRVPSTQGKFLRKRALSRVWPPAPPRLSLPPPD